MYFLPSQTKLNLSTISKLVKASAQLLLTVATLVVDHTDFPICVFGFEILARLCDDETEVRTKVVN